MEAEALAGGNMSGAVVRVGDTVRKPGGPQSATVQRLAAHVRALGLEWVQEPLGTDDDGRDVWGFIPGEVVHDAPAWLRGDGVLVEIARRLREWHDATVTFERRPGDVWWWPGKRPAEVICHVDFAPYNHVYRDGEFVGLIDLDICYPGPRLWDLAYTAYRYVPLLPHVDDDVPDGGVGGGADGEGGGGGGGGADRTVLPRAEVTRRLGLFLEAYAGDDGRLLYPASGLLGYVPPRLDAMADWCAQQDSAELRRHGLMYRAHARWIEGGALGAARVVEVGDVG